MIDLDQRSVKSDGDLFPHELRAAEARERLAAQVDLAAFVAAQKMRAQTASLRRSVAQTFRRLAERNALAFRRGKQ